MRFLMLNWRDPKNPLSGGAERVTHAYLNALAERGHEVYQFSYAFPGGKPYEKIDGVHILRGGGMFTAIQAARKWYKQQPRFDLVIDQHHGIPWYAPWWCKTNNVSYIHEVLGPIWNSFYPWPVSSVGRWQERLTHRFYRDIPFFTASTFTREKLIEHGVKSVTIIPYGVHTVALPTLEPKVLAEPLQLIMVSRLAPNKRLGHGIEALRSVIQLGIRAELTVVGTGEEEAKLKELTKNLKLEKSVHFTGPLAEREKDALLQQAHFLLHTSQREGWGLNVIEANAMGTPAVVYPVAGLVESTLHDETGMVAAEENPASIAESLRTILRSPERYQHYRVQAWERSKTFHWNQVLPKACNWFEEMARRKRPA